MSTNLSEMSDYECRAFAAYLRGGAPGEIVQQPSNVIETEHEDLGYVGVYNISGTLAMYRITNRGSLKRLKRWPAILNDW